MYTNQRQLDTGILNILEGGAVILSILWLSSASICKNATYWSKKKTIIWFSLEYP